MDTTTAAPLAPLTQSPSGKPLPKSYLSAEAREKVLREEDFDALCSEENFAAYQAGDMNAAWAWSALIEDRPPETLLYLKLSQGAQFIRDMGFNTATADAVYGVGWLDRELKL